MNPRTQLYKFIGEQIRKARGQMSQQALAEALTPPLTRASISNIEHGRQNVYLHTLYDIARVLDLDVVKLLPKTGGAETLKLRVTEQLRRHKMKESLSDQLVEIFQEAQAR